MKQFLHPSPGILRVFVACLLSFTILITPIAAVAAPSIAKASTVKNKDGKKRDQAKSAAEELFVNPPTAMPASALPGPQPQPAPEPLAPPPPLPPAAVTASMTAALVSTPNNNSGPNAGKADPGDTINYTVQLSNTSGAPATGLNFNVPLDSHTTIVPGSLNSTPVAFDQNGLNGTVAITTNEDPAVPPVITLQGQDPDGSALTFSIVAPPTNGSLGSIGSVSCVSGVCSANVTYTPNLNFNGTDTFTFKVNDGTADSNQTGAVSITVNAVNDPPTFSGSGNPGAVNEDAGAQSVANFRTSVSPGPANESGQTVSFVVTGNTNPSLFSSAPALNVSGTNATLTYTSALNQNGTATITYHAQDDGGTAFGGVDHSADATFVITVNAVNDPPVVVAPAAYSAFANMKVTGLTGLLGNVNDNADNGVNGCSSTTFTVTSGSISATSPAGGVISNVNLSSGTFDFDPPPGITGDVTFTYTVSDTGCPGVAISAPVTVHVTVSGTVIWFVNPGAGPDTTHTGTLANPFQLLASANTAMGLNAGQRIFVFTGTTTSGVGVSLTTSQWLIGQGATNSGNTSNFDTFMGISPPANTIARPAVNGTKPTIQGRVQMNASNTRVQGVAIAPPAGTQGLTGTSGSAMTGMQVGVSATQSDVTVSTTGQSGTNAMGVSLNNAGGVFTFISVNVNQDAVPNKPAKGISLTSTTGTFNILGSGTTAGSGGTIQNVNGRGIEVIGAAAVASQPTLSIKNMNLTTTAQTNTEANPTNCGATSPSGGNINCNAAIHLNNVNGATFDNININGTLQNGINGLNVIDLKILNSTVQNAGNDSGESGVFIQNLSGLNTALTNSTFTNNRDWQFAFVNFTNGIALGNGGSPFNVSNCTFTGKGNTVTSEDGFLGRAGGTSTAVISIGGGANSPSHFKKNFSYGVFMDAINSASLTATVNGNDFGAGGAANYNNSGIATGISGGASVNYTFSNNTITGIAFGTPGNGVGIVVTTGTTVAGASIIGTISGNTIGETAVSGSGGLGNAAAMQLLANGGGPMIYKATVTGNHIHNPTALGIQYIGGTMTGAVTGTLHITGNDISTDNVPAGFPAGQAIAVAAAASGTLPSAQSTLCADISGNTITGTWDGANTDRIRVTTLRGSIYTVGGMPGSGAQTAAAVATFVGSQNGAAPPLTSSSNTASGGGTFNANGGNVCAPLLLAEGGVLAALKAPPLLESFFLFGLNSSGYEAIDLGSSIAAPSTVSTSLDQQHLDSIVSAAMQRWSSTGLTAQQVSELRSIKFDVADLSVSYLGEADGDHILVDRAAQGKGWFIDPTPQDDSEFGKASATRRYTDPMSAPAGHVDLLTAIMHEMGHKLGLGDSYAEQDRDNLMYGYLTVGERRLPSKGQAATATPGQYTSAHFLSLLPSAETPVSASVSGHESVRTGLAASPSDVRKVSEQSEVRGQKSEVSRQPSRVQPQSGAMSIARAARNNSQLRRSEILPATAPNIALLRSARTEFGAPVYKHAVPTGLRLNHARRVSKTNNSTTTSSPSSSLAPMFVSPPPGTFPVNGTGTGFSMPNGKTITITFSVTLNNPPNLSGVPPATPQVSQQGSLTGAFSGNPIVTDDPGTGAANDATVTPVDLFDTTTTVTSLPTSSNTGQSVTFTAAIGTTGTPSGSGTNRTGTVNFKSDGTTIPGCGAQTVGAVTVNQATCTTSGLSTTTHVITAEYAGDGNFDPSSGTLAGGQIVNQSGTSVTLHSSLNPAFVSQNITFTATVTTSTSVPNPTGTVTFKDGGGAITCTGGSQTLNGSGVATCQISTLAAGNHTITADYSGDTNFSANNGTALTVFGGQAGNPQIVAQSTPTVTLGSSLNPSRVTQNVTFTGTVTAPAGITGTPAGTLAFKDGGNPITCSNAGGQILNGSGVGTCQVATLPAGTHVITADYVGDGSANGTAKFNNASGTLSPDQVVNKSDTTTTVTAAPPGSSAPASPVVFTAAVTSQTVVTGPPAGKAQFFDGATPITCTGAGQSGTSTGETLASGSADCTTSTLTTAVHSITAQYTGDGSANGSATFNGSTSSALSYTVGNPCSNSVVVTSSLNTGPNTLREAIDTKVCDGGTITFSGVTLINLATPLSITRPMTINGPGAGTLTVSGNTVTRIFDVSSAQPVTISGMTMSNGKVVGGTGAPESGAGIRNTGSLTLSSVTLSGNQATGGVGAAGATGGAAFGGAIMNSGTLALNNSTVNGSNNATGGNGGDSAVANGNGGSAFGGGIYNTGTFTLNNTTVASNNVSGGAAGSGAGTAGVVGNGFGGGIYNDATASADVVTIFNSTISGNTASSNGGGIANVGLLSNASLAIINSTISGNMSNNDGGGLYNDSVSGTTTITSSTVSNNHADNDASSAGTGGGIRVVSGPVTLKDTIVAGNFATSLQVETATVTGGPITSGVKQKETITVSGGPVVNNGDILVKVTAAGVNGGATQTLTVTLAASDNNTDVAIRIKNALLANVPINNFFNVTTASADVILEAKARAANDGTMHVSIVGSVTGINNAESTPTTAGVAPVTGVKQAETVTVASPISGCATTSVISVIVTADNMPGSPVTLHVPETNAQDETQVADAIRAFIDTDASAANVKAFFTITGAGTPTLIFTAQTAAANDPNMHVRIISDTCTITQSDNSPSGTGVAPVAAVQQVETITVSGAPVIQDGSIRVIVTAFGMSNSPKTVLVPLTAALDTTNTIVATDIASALNLDPDVGPFFTVTSSSANVILTKNTAATNDGTMHVSIRSTTGINSTESSPTTPGASSGSATITVTASAGITGSPRTINVPVATGDTAADVAAKMRAALIADTEVNNRFMVTGAGVQIVLTRRVVEANDNTLNIATANGTAAGLTDTPISADTKMGGTATPDDISGAVAGASSYNLVGVDTGLTGISNADANKNQVGTVVTPIDPKLGPLANNGGSTFTHKLLATSPALETGINPALTTLNGAIDNSTTTVNVTSAANIPVGVTILVDTLTSGTSEQMLVTAKTGNALTVTRHVNGTAANAHSDLAPVFPAFDQRGFLRTVNSDAAAPLAVGGDDTDIGAYELQTQAGAPNAPDLDAASDTGVSNTDNITADTSPTFTITGVASGAFVELLRDTNNPVGGSPSVVTSGTAVGSSIQLTDPSVAAGDYLYTARQTVSGAPTSAQSSALPVTIDTSTPATPDAPDLTDASDSGTSNSDNLTNATAPVFNIGNVTAGFTVDLLRDGSVVASGVVAAASSSILLTDNTNPPAGLRNYTSRQTNGGSSTSSTGSLNVTFDRTAPAAPGTPNLQDGSDTFGVGTSGTNSDNITNAATRAFDVIIVAEANSTVTLLRNNAPVPGAGATASGASSPVTLTDSNTPIDAVYLYSVVQTDAAGNTSAESATLSVTLDRTDAPNTPDLQAASDSFGASTTGTNSDNLTRTTPRSFDITGTESGALVELLRAGGSITSTTGTGGTVTLTDPTVLGDAAYIYQTRQTDIAGNVVTSSGLTVNIDTTSNAPGTPDLQTGSDAGTSHTDDRTDNATHSFDIASLTGAFVELLRDGTPVSSVTALGASVTLTDSASLADGLYHYSARQTDPAGNGPASSGTLDVTIDTTAPTVSSVTRVNPSPTSAASVQFTVTFSESVTGVDAADFVTFNSGGISGTSVTTVTGSGTTYTVTVSTGSGDGNLRLDVVTTDAVTPIKDVMNLPLGAGFTTGEVYIVDRLNPFVSSIVRAGANPTNAVNVDFTVTFSEAVTGVNITGPNSDFVLATTGTIAGATISNLTGSGTTYTVTVNTGSGEGTIKLNLTDNDSIIDATSKPLAPAPGTSAGDGSFTTGQVYDIDKTPPTVTVTVAAGQVNPVTGPTASTVINFKVVFGESVNGFTSTDVNLSGAAGATVANVSGSGTTYNVAVEGMTSSGAVTITIPAAAATDAAGNGNTSVNPTNTATVTFNKNDFTTFEVNTIVDADDGACAPVGTGNGCTLREAINAANADADAETITFAPALTSGGPATISLLTALPIITTDMTIQGPGANLLTVERNSGAGTNFRIFTVNTGTVIISGLTISKGVLASSGQGGGIFNNTGATLTINNCAISGNQVGSSGFGGGIYSAGTLTLNSSTVNDNHVNTSGGGAGGIYDVGPLMNINNSTISGNTTGTDSKGGGILNTNALPLVISNSTVTLNTTGTGALSAGGGIYLAAANLTLKNSIVGGGNSSPVGPDISGTLQSDGFNLIQSTSGATINQNVGAGPNITGVDPLLFALANNGGPTFTHALQCTSPAIDKGKNFGLTTDQRGGTRPFDLADSVYPNAVGGDGSDIGAYETQTGGGCLPLAVPPAPAPATNEDTPVVITLTGTYSQNFALTFSITQQPVHSTANLVPSAASCTFTTFMTCTSTVSYTPSANFNGLDAFKFKASAGGLDSEEADVNITVNPVNDQPLALSQSVVTDEDTPLPITLAGADVETPAGSLAFTVTVQPLHGTLSGTAPNVTYTPNLNYNGPDSFKFTVTDTGDGPSPPLTSAAATISITVNAVNDAPVLDNSGNMSLSAINEDVAAASNTGTLVSGVIASAGGARITDVDAGAVQGLAVIAVDNTNGTWQFSMDNGTNWAPFGTPDSLNARLLAANATTRVRFLPNLNFNGTVDPGLTFRAWDQTSGTNGNTADVSIVGGTTAFSIAIETASITVNPVNDQPTADSQSVAANEDTALPVTLTGSDVETPSGSLIFNLTVQPLHGVLSGTGANRTYTPAANYNGPDSFKFSITDTGDGSSPALTSAEASVSITVNAVNDAPSFTKGADQTANGPVPQTVPNWATNISAGPPDESGQTLTFLVSNNNNAIFSVQPSISPSGTLTFTPAYGFDGTATVTVKLQDNGGVALGGVDTSAPQTFTITVHALNNPPTLNALGNVIVNEDALLQTVNLSGITAGPIYESSQNLTVTAASNNTAVIPNPTVTYSSPNTTGSISFTPVPNANGSAMITVTVKDDGGTANGGVDTFVRTFIVTVNAINDAPVNHVPGSQNAPLNGNSRLLGSQL